MKALDSYLEDRWVSGSEPFAELRDPTSGDITAHVSSKGLDRRAALHHARTVGGPALRAMTFAQRAAMIEQLAKAIHAHRDELLELSRRTGGTTRGDGKFDIDGAASTMQYYAYLGRDLGDRRVLVDGEAEGLLRSKRFVGQHVLVSRPGVAIHINAFNFPAWGLAEKAAVAWLAGMPVVAKPGIPTGEVSQRIAQLWVETGVLPPGAFTLVMGEPGDLLDHVGPMDCVAFTGSSATAQKIRQHPAVQRHNVRLNIEADSLNAYVLGPDVEPGTDTWEMFINQTVTDLLQKSGQKCTAVRRIVVPHPIVDDVIGALTDRLSGITVGEPGEKGTDIGPLVTAQQQARVNEGLASLASAGVPVFQADAPPQGAFVKPSLFRVEGGVAAPHVHDTEVFGPVSAVLPCSGEVDEVVDIVVAAGGGLVCSIYSDDPEWAAPVIWGLAPWHGRIHWGSRKVHDQSPGPGTVLPNLVHGGPGKAGGGEELGGLRGLSFYFQRTAIQADRSLIERIVEADASMSQDNN
ncbi:MAG: 3,4-dehydroadipyl-CoA semialdehyde dehydrogenase [Myxococcota bacterium]